MIEQRSQLPVELNSDDGDFRLIGQQSQRRVTS
jgi:hypothetical protein